MIIYKFLFSILFFIIISCETENVQEPWWYDCIEEVCDYLPECSPVVPALHGNWDWRTKQKCLNSMTCGSDGDACIEAVYSLVCIGPGPTPELRELHIKSVMNVKKQCSHKIEKDTNGSGGVSNYWDKGLL